MEKISHRGKEIDGVKVIWWEGEKGLGGLECGSHRS